MADHDEDKDKGKGKGKDEDRGQGQGQGQGQDQDAGASHAPPDTQPSLQMTCNLPEWETITHPPKPRQSFIGRILPIRSDSDEPIAMMAPLAAAPDSAQSKEVPGRATVLPLYQVAAAGPVPAKPTLMTSLKTRFNARFPPYRIYCCGLSRRALLLCLVLPLAILLFIVAPLAIGLGVGLTRRSSDARASSVDLPLPGNRGTFTGELIYTSPGFGPGTTGTWGVCGVMLDVTDYAASVSHLIFDAVDEQYGTVADRTNPLCGMQIRVTRDADATGVGNLTVTVTVVDRCVNCMATDLRLSALAFFQLDPEYFDTMVGNWTWVQ
ncbi:hypothetical protein GGS23DRAFT_112706 [Durotheca rogersii]|uniref:uncharacterized protein n=1 Tax=Durotheca rogersii TaxID=419775 RepID=UPI00221F1948|nr:uncharacterized protein GGS23DRAFT_112706 [Durotheca rogersii]KAI5862232.1 hypothetical protein GGS23DRAFT_112706 [Durotheca rogersii]